MDKPTELLHKLMHSITTIHLDMGGDHKYALSFKSHKILTEINTYLNTPHGEGNRPDACECPCGSLCEFFKINKEGVKMNFKLKERTLLNGDIVSPDIPYAVFDTGISMAAVKKIVCTLNRGHNMILLYKQYRDNLHINNVTEMIKQMETAYQKYKIEMYIASKNR